jgi:hypothetical protein
MQGAMGTATGFLLLGLALTACGSPKPPPNMPPPEYEEAPPEVPQDAGAPVALLSPRPMLGSPRCRPPSSTER